MRRAIVLSVLVVAVPARAQEGLTGDGASATPALGRVLVASEVEPGVDAAATAGYGYTEDVLGTGGAHHRVAGSLAVAARPIRWLTIGGRFDGRWDHHVELGGDDQSAVGEPRLLVRGDVAIGSGIALGLAAVLFVPGADAPSLALEASTLDLRGLVSWAPAGLPLVVAVDLGWRFDGTARAAQRPIPFGRADLVSLGASDSDALLLGAGAALRFDPVEIFAELTADVLVESGTSASPVRLAAGARATLLPRWLAAYAALEVGLGGRAPVDPAGTLVPVEPRVAFTLGLLVSPRSAPPVRLDDAESGELEADVEPAVELEPAGPRAVSGRVLDPSGSPLAGAVVRTEREDPSAPRTTTAADGRFTLDEVPPETALIVEADGYVAMRLAPGETALEATMERALPSGALRGLVRSHSGRALSATIRVEPGGMSATTDADGVFELELAPGRYEVTIEAEGHVVQTREIEVDEGGVTVINADLRRAH